MTKNFRLNYFFLEFSFFIFISGCNHQLGPIIEKREIAGNSQNLPSPVATLVPTNTPSVPSGSGDHGQTEDYQGVTAPFQDCASAKLDWNFEGEYFCNQWHIFNFGQQVSQVPSSTPFGDPGDPTIDLTLYETWKNYHGENMKVSIVDSGTFSHPDLNPNFISGVDACTGSNNIIPIPAPGSLGRDHGIQVAGLIVANGKVSGVARLAKYYMNNLVSCGIDDRRSDPSASMKIAQSLYQPVANTHNSSWGNPSCDTGFGFGIAEQQMDLLNAAENGAMNQDIFYTKSAGNENNCLAIANADPLNSSPYLNIIAALDNEGAVTSYSSRGPNLSFASLAGYGYPNQPEPGVVTTIVNLTNEEPGYTSRMNGTSSAAPVHNGASILIRQALPGFKWYEITALEIMNARSSNRGSDQNFTTNSPISSSPYINKVKNAKNYFHSWHTGFGLVNVDKSIHVGKTTFQRLPALKKFSASYNNNAWATSSSTADQAIASGQCQEKILTINKENFQIFTLIMSMKVTIASIKNIIATLKSPSGTEVQVFRQNNLPGSNLTLGQYHKVMGFFAEQSKGDWRLKVCATSSAVFGPFKMDIIGFDGSPIPENNL
ncbi:MAG: S8 family serine peptidase [Bacteriovoracaceae bacterium]|nr:S8 family serine peptidase [Bacteriovoracaceae bacterium]